MLRKCIGGIQHSGITVENMERSIEFYTEILGGVLVCRENNLSGEILHNTLFQQEELAAQLRGLQPRTLGVPDLRDGTKEVLAVAFISFGDQVVELLHVRPAGASLATPNILGAIPSIVTHTTSMHLSFYVKDDVDLNQFVQELEQESANRGFTNVKCNRVVHVNSPDERAKVARKYYSNKFWNAPDSFIQGYSDRDFGALQGWALVYCKGPSGEQLEFNQVRLKAKDLFAQARDRYFQQAKVQ
jgi:catechol 2,3-dioxygenase-like lactoylglutathione lyase family enzyme